MRRLEETLRQMVQAAKAIGNTELENKFNEGLQILHSTYLVFSHAYFCAKEWCVCGFTNCYLLEMVTDEIVT